MPNIFWIDANVENPENLGYQRQIRNLNAFRFKKFTNIDECIEKLKKIEFKKTFIIVSGSSSKDFFTKMECIVNELFSFFKTFSSPGKYKFIFSFKNLLTNANNLFYKCKSLISIDLKYFKTNNITNMNNMFNGCSNLETLDLLGFKTKEVTSMRNSFMIIIH